MTTQYNIVSYGTLTNTNGVLSNFSASNYATIPLNFNPVQRPFEVVFKFVGANGVIWNVGDVTTARGHIEFEIYQSKLYAEASANTTLIWSIDGVTTLSPNTNYWAKLAYNGVDTYSLYLSADGITWNTEGTVTSSAFLADGSTEYNLIGCQTENGVITYPFDGSIDLNESYISIDNIRWWQGVTSVSNVQTRIQLRHDTAANWTSVNPILLEGEVGIETDTLKQKVGDGSTAWNSLSYQSEIFIAEHSVTTYADTLNAYNAGKTILLTIGNGDYHGILYTYTGEEFRFVVFSESGSNKEIIFFKLNQYSGWNNGTSKTIVNDNLSNVTTISSNSAVQTALDSKVNKSGDTMTGNLVVSTDSTNNFNVALKNTNSVISSTPSSNTFTSLAFTDNNNNALGRVLLRDTTTSREMRLRVDGYNGIANDAVCIGFDINNTAYCTFPNTTCVDGQWTNSNSGNIINGSNITWTTGHSYDLSSYLPNDGKIYEVIFQASWTGSTAGVNHTLRASTDVITSAWNWLGRVFGTDAAAGICILPVGTRRYVKLTTEAKGCNSVYFSALGYRRLGTNS